MKKWTRKPDLGSATALFLQIRTSEAMKNLPLSFCFMVLEELKKISSLWDSEIAPNAAILSPRGKVLENGMPRFFRRLAEGVFDLRT